MDLNLMQAFHAVYTERSVSRAAESLGLSQPAVSHALRRLRSQFGDPLFVRTPGGVTPTAKADRLAQAVQHALHTLDMAIQEADAFDPAASERVFRLHMSDIGEVMFLPRLMQRLRQQAPGIRLLVQQLEARDIGTALENGSIDLAVGYLPDLAGVQSHRLLGEWYEVLLRADHPLAGRRMNPALLRELDYVVVRSHTAAARKLDELGLTAKVRLTLPHFMVIPGIVASTDLAVLLPSRLASHFKAQGAFHNLKLPGQGKPFDVAIHWFWRFESDPGNRWLRSLMLELFEES